MSDEQHKARLKHASEVLGWLAEGKTLQGRRPVVGADWENLTPDEKESWDEAGVVGAILGGRWEYRIKPEPVVYRGVVDLSAYGRSVSLPQDKFPVGSKVEVTLLEP